MAESSTTTPVAASKKYGGFDISVRLPTLLYNHGITLKANVSIDGGDPGAYVDFFYRGSTLLVNFRVNNTTTQFTGATPVFFNSRPANYIRLVWTNEFVHFYVNDKFIYTIAFRDIEWINEDIYLLPYSQNLTPITLPEVRVTELYNTRTAIYMDMEASGMSAISNILQGRPIEIIPNSTGNLRFSYNNDREVVTANDMITNYKKRKGSVRSAASDAVAYYSDVSVVRNTKFLKSKGFLTRIYRVSELDGADALKVVKKLLDIAVDSRVTYTINMRPDVRFEVGDVCSCTLVASGTGTSYSAIFVVEQITLEISPGVAKMVLSGREFSQ